LTVPWPEKRLAVPPMRLARLIGSAFLLAVVLAGSAQVGAVDTLPSFGRPTIVGIQAGGNSEPGLRIDTHGRIYVTAPFWPYSALWRSLDGGATFKWIPAADAGTGRLPTCQRQTGGDAEIATDAAGRLYFSDPLSADASPYNTAARSDDQGRTFRSTCNAVDNDSTDRPWFAVDGDPLAGGAIYLAVAIIGDDHACASDSLAVARSPVPGREADAGIVFAPLKVATGPCAMGGAGNTEVSPTTHEVLVAHVAGGDVKARGIGEVRLVRCARAEFTAANPSGLSCDDVLVARTPGAYTGSARVTVDRAGNLYVVWMEQSFDSAHGSSLIFATSRNGGDTWSAPAQIPTPGLRSNEFSWPAAGDSGRLDVAWYGSSAVDEDATRGCGGSADVTGDWGVYFTQTLNGLDVTPSFTAPLLVSEHFVHRGGIGDIPSGKFCGNGTLGDFLTLRIGTQGDAAIVYADSNNANGVYKGLNNANGGQLAHPMFVHQTGGPSAYADASLPGTAPATNAVTDARGDAKPNLDLLGSSIVEHGKTYRITLRVADLRTLRSSGADKTLMWLAEWFSPSRTDAKGGKNLFASMESTNGARPTFWVGESAERALPTRAPSFTYPGARRVTGSYTRSAPGTITIVVPASAAFAPNPVAATLFSVTASTMTLAEPAEKLRPVRDAIGYYGGSFFTLVDSAPSFDFTARR